MLALGLLTAMFAFVLLPTSEALAAGNVVSSNSGAERLTANCSDYAGLTNKVASCIRDTLEKVTDKFFADFYPLVQGAIAGFLTLGVAIYGVMAAAGMIEKIGRDTVVIAIKYSMIGYFVLNTQMLYDLAINSMDDLAAAVVTFAPDKGTANENFGSDHITCMENMKKASAAAKKSYNPAWLSMDCMIDSVIGIKMPEDGHVGRPAQGAAGEWINDNLESSDPGMSRGMLYLFFSSMSTSIVGILLAIVGFVFIYGMLHLIIKALFVYLAGYIGIAFLMIFAPLFIPLVLFKRTKEYFDKWVKLIVSFMLQPIIILVFMIFSLAAMDLAMFSGDYSLMYRIAGEKSREEGFSLNKYLTDNKAIIDKPSTLALQITGRETTEGQVSEQEALLKVFNSECIPSNMRIDTALKERCSQAYPVKYWHESLDWEALAKARTNPAVERETGADNDGEQISREVIAAALFCAMVVFVMNALLGVVPMIANDLIGDLYQSPNLSSPKLTSLPNQQEAQISAGRWGRQMQDMVSGRGGTQ